MAVSFTILGAPANLPDWTGTVPEQIGEIALKKFIEYNNEIAPTMPETMKALADVEDEIAEVMSDKKRKLKLREQKAKELREKHAEMLKAIPEITIKTEWLQFYEREIQFWSGFPNDYKGIIAIDDLMSLRTLINNLVGKYVPKRDRESFEFNGAKWYLPPAEMNGSSLIEFIEAAQYEHNYKKILEGSKMEVDEIGLKITSRWNSLLPLLCILSRKEDERNVVEWYRRNNQQSPSEFFDRMIDERKEIFCELPMDVALDVFFSFSESRASYLIRMVQRSQSSAART